MTAQDDYRRAAGTNQPDNHETKKMQAVHVRIPRTEKMIYAAMLLVIVINAVMAAKQNGWL